MKKFIFMILAAFIMISSNCYATPVRVCDFGISTFCTSYNKIISDFGKYNQLFLNGQVEKVGSNDIWDLYTVPVGQDKGRSFGFYVNKEGYISSISIVHEKFGNQKTTLATLIATLYVVGLNFNEIEYFSNNFDNIMNYQNVYTFIPTLNRYIRVLYDSPEHYKILTLESFMILAYVD